MSISKIGSVFLYGSLSKESFLQIAPLVWKRNKRILNITSLLSAAMGGLFLLYTLLANSGTWLPYLILLFGSVLIFFLNRWTSGAKDKCSMVLCYGQMLLVCVYAGILSVQAGNYAIPATSVVVFIALIPLSIDDRLARMFVFMLLESASYLAVSRFFKSSGAFSLDIMNVGTFCLIGMILYGVICTRNIREIYQGVRIETIQKSVISSMATVVEERDESTGGHILRTSDYVRKQKKKMKKEERYSHLKEDYFGNILLAAPMHDIGKIKIPDTILNKPGKLTEEEYAIMKEHSELGADIIKRTMRGVENEEYFQVACNIAKYHHERYDGKGYPEGLAGEAIPLEARIMALADVYDALISERVYKKPFSKEEAEKIMAEGSGTQFDPELLALFLECIAR